MDSEMSYRVAESYTTQLNITSCSQTRMFYLLLLRKQEQLDIWHLLIQGFEKLGYEILHPTAAIVFALVL